MGDGPLRTLLSRSSILDKYRASSKKQALQHFGDVLATQEGLDPHEVFEGLMERERLGSTGVGRGVAIPHTRVKGLGHMTGLFARLDEPIDFEALDGDPVDVVFMLLAPIDSGTEHLQTLARVARFLRNSDNMKQLRAGDQLTAALSPFLAEEENRVA